MALVFIHGVNTRATDPGYEEAVKLRNAYFTNRSLKGIPGAGGVPLNPSWGHLGCTFPWNMAFAKGGDGVEAFGSNNRPIITDVALNLLAKYPQAQKAAHPLLTIAQQPQLEAFVDAVDFLLAASAVVPEKDTVPADQIASFGLLAVDYARANQNPKWVTDARTDAEFVAQLTTNVDKPLPAEELGPKDILDRLKRGASALADKVADAAITPIARSGKPALLKQFSRFFGDAFEYLKQSWSGSDEIRKHVESAIRQAVKDAGPTDKLIILGHSMGGNIAYDLLTSAARDVRCDLFLTVGSQVGLFEELKLFRSSNKEIPNGTKKVPPVKNIKRWVNVFDPIDPFGYPAREVFEQVEDLEFNTGASPLSAHGAYFFAPGFHDRLHERLEGLLK